MAMIYGIHSVSIFVNDPDRAIPFYRDALGLPVERQGKFGAEFRAGGALLGIYPARRATARALVGRHTGVTLAVDDLEGFCVRLRSRGVSFTSELSRTPWGRIAMIADPDGNVLALMDREDLESSPAR